VTHTATQERPTLRPTHRRPTLKIRTKALTAVATRTIKVNKATIVQTFLSKTRRGKIKTKEGTTRNPTIPPTTPKQTIRPLRTIGTILKMTVATLKTITSRAIKVEQLLFPLFSSQPMTFELFAEPYDDQDQYNDRDQYDPQDDYQRDYEGE
jgi:hypothetical protein